MSTTFPIERRASHRLPPAPAPDDAFGLRSAAAAVMQHSRLALGVFGLTFGAALAYQWLVAPVYRADTVLEIDARARSTLLPNLGGNERAGQQQDPQLIGGEMELLRSRDVLLPVIAAAGADVEIGGARRWGFVPVGARHDVRVKRLHVPDALRGERLRLRVEGERFELADADGARLAEGVVGRAQPFRAGGGTGIVELAAGSPDGAVELTVSAGHMLKVYDNVLKRLRMFEPSRESNVVRLSFEDTDPARAAALLNALVLRYVEQAVQRRTNEYERALAFLERQLPGLEARVSAAEDKLREQQAQSSAAPLNTEAEALLRQRAELERQLVDLRVKRDQLAQTLTPEHPDLAAVLAQQETVRRAIGRMQGLVSRLPVQQRDLQPVQRELQISTQLYSALLTHVQQLRIQAAAGLPSARALDSAVAPIEPVRPLPAAVLALGAAFGLVLGIAAALARRALRPTVAGPADIEGLIAPPTLGVIPASSSQNRLMESGWGDSSAIEEIGTHRLLVRSAPNDPATESLRAIHLALTSRLRNRVDKVIMVTSPMPGTGKGFVAANLAALMAESGKLVLLVEADLRKPRVYKLMGMDEHAPGLSDLLAGERVLGAVVHQHAAIEMDVLLHGTETTNPGALLVSGAFEQIISELRERYDHIVINAAPLLPSGDAVAVGRVADVVLMVVRSEKTALRETQLAQRRLEQAGIALEGILVNGAKRSRLGGSRIA